MAQILDLGKFRFDYRGAYSNATQYERNDVVTYGGNVYVYKFNTASTGNIPTMAGFWDLMVEGFNYRGNWSEATQYLIADLVSFGGKVYIALQDGSGYNPVTATSYWSVFVDGIQYEGEWASGTNYQKGDVVKYGGNVWIAVANSIASAPATANVNWEILVYGVEFKGVYVAGTAYKVNDIVSYGGKSYINIIASTGVVPTNTTNWAAFSQGFQFEGTWSSATSYQAGDVVNYGGLVYVAIADSLNSAPTDTAYWAVLIEGIAYKGAYAAPTTYNKNDIVSYAGSSWIAKQNTTGNAPVVGANWDILAAGTYPSFAGNTGKFLSNDGAQAVWVSDVTVTDLTATSQAFIGTDAGAFETNASLTNAVEIRQFSDGLEVDGFAQLAFRNTDRTSSADIQLFSNNGNDNTGWASFGITGSDFSAANYGITGPNDAYLFHDAPATITKTITNKALASNVATLTTGTTHGITVGAKAVITGVDATFNGTYYVTAVPSTTTFSYAKTAANVASAAVSPVGSVTFNGGGQGNIVLATGANGSQNKIIFAAGGFTSGLTQMEITPGVNVHIEIPTPSTSPSTGALTVVGGVGVQGAMNIAGNVAIVGTLTFGGSGQTTVIDTLSTSDSLVRTATDNTDDLIDLGIVSEYTEAVSNVSRSVSNKVIASEVATLTTTAAHTYSVGDVVVVTGVDATFNGTYVVSAIPSATTFSYKKTGAAAVASAAVSPVGTANKTRARRYFGLVRDATDGITKLFDGLTVAPGTTVDFSNAGLTFDALRVGPLTATTATLSTGLTSTAGSNSIANLTLSGASSSFGGTIAGDATFSGNPTFSGTPVFSGTPTFSGTPAFTGGIRIQEMIEDVVDVTLSSNVAVLDYSLGNIFFLTNTPSAAMTWQITNAPTTDGRVFTINVLVTQGSTGFIPTSFTINGSAATMRFAAGVTPTPTSSSGKIDIFTLTVVRRASSFTLLGSANLNF